MIHIFTRNCQHEIVTQAVASDFNKRWYLLWCSIFHKWNKSKTVYTHNINNSKWRLVQLYRYHTNSTANAGEVQGIIAEKNLPLKDMEMMQFHPTVVQRNFICSKTFLSEALRGRGAYIVDDNGYRFLFDYHKDGELASKMM